MSFYTTELRYICEEYWAQSHQGEVIPKDTLQICTDVHKMVFNFQYPLSDEIKDEFEIAFLMHYYFNEIGQPPIGRWRHFLKQKLLLISDEYNQLLKSTQLEYNILDEIDITEQDLRDFQENKDRSDDRTRNENRDTQTNNTQNTETDDYTLNKLLNTPQGNLNNVLENSNYLTRIDDSTYNSDTTDTTNQTENESKDTTDKNKTLEDNTEHETNIHTEKGRRTPAPDLIMKYRNAIICVVEQLVNEFEDSFMCILEP